MKIKIIICTGKSEGLLPEDLNARSHFDLNVLELPFQISSIMYKARDSSFRVKITPPEMTVTSGCRC